MERLTQLILATAAALPEGELLHAKALLHLGSRSAVDQSLSRLVRRAQLIRVGRGAFALPIQTEFGPRPPSARKIVEKMAEATGEVIAGNPAEAANSLRLTTQVPARRIFLTTGSTRKLNLSLPGLEAKTGASAAIELRHAPRWQLVLSGKPAGRVVRAMAWAMTEIEFGRKRRQPGARGAGSKAQLASLRRQRAEAARRVLRQVAGRLTEAERNDLMSARPQLPSWVAEPVSEILASGSERILETAVSLPEGELLQAKALLHLGSRTAVDQALSRLVRRGRLIRAGRGIYLKPIATRFGPRVPETGKVVGAISRNTGETIASSVATAANALGITTQVPIRQIYVTSGKSRSLRLGLRESAGNKQASGIEVELRHAPRWQLLMPGHPAGEIVRAIAWAAGESTRLRRGRPSAARNRARAGVAEETLRQALRRAPAGTLETLARARPHLPTWIAEPVSRVFSHGR